MSAYKYIKLFLDRDGANGTVRGPNLSVENIEDIIAANALTSIPGPYTGDTEAASNGVPLNSLYRLSQVNDYDIKSPEGRTVIMRVVTILLLILSSFATVKAQFITNELIAELDTMQITDPGDFRSPWRYSRSEDQLYRWDYTTLTWEKTLSKGFDLFVYAIANNADYTLPLDTLKKYNRVVLFTGSVTTSTRVTLPNLSGTTGLSGKKIEIRYSTGPSGIFSVGSASNIFRYNCSGYDIDEGPLTGDTLAFSLKDKIEYLIYGTAYLRHCPAIDVTGTGTTNRTALWTAANTIGNSYLLQSASAITLDAGKMLTLTGGTTASMPAAIAGGHWYNTTLNNPQWSDGTSWFPYSYPWIQSGSDVYFNTGGNVSIGTANPPTARLTVSGDFTASGTVAFEMKRAGVSNAFLRITNVTNNGGQFIPGFVGQGNYVSGTTALGLYFIGSPIQDNSSDDTAITFSGRTHAGGAMANGSIADFYNSTTALVRIMASGKIGVGVADPTAFLHLKAGTTAAGTGPLKFTSGPLLTTPEPGLVEFDTDRWYGTITTGAARKGFAFTDEIASTVGTNLGTDDVPRWDGAEFQPSGITSDDYEVSISRSTAPHSIRFFQRYNIPNATPSSSSGITSVMAWNSSNVASFRVESTGVASGSTDGSGDLVVTIPTMPDATYAILATPNASIFHNVVITSWNTTSFTARFFDATGAAIASTAVSLNWQVKDY